MAGPLVALCLLHLFGGVARAGNLGHSLDLWTSARAETTGGCNACNLDKMVVNCPLDVMFVLDMSDSITRRSYEIAREYVASEMQSVTSTFQGTQVGFMAFSNIVHTDIPIRARTENEMGVLMSQVRNQKQERDSSQLAAAFRRAREALVAHHEGALVPGKARGRLIVLVTDGCDDSDRAVRTEAMKASAQNISIISVAMSQAYVSLLKSISVQILELRTYIDWNSVVACPKNILPPVEPGAACGDMVIAMDGSDSVRRWETVMRHYLSFTAMRFRNNPNAMGVVVFGTNVNTQSAETMLAPTTDKVKLAQKIEDTLSFPSRRGTGTTAAINKSRDYLQSLGTSNAAAKTIVVITDGPALHPEDARKALENARSQGLMVVVIVVGNSISVQELQAMTGPKTIIRQVASYIELYHLDLSSFVCQAVQCTVNCPLGFKLDTNACACVRSCPNTCGLPQIQNPITCDCGCPNPCPSGQVQDANSCICSRRLCDNTCTAAQVQNPTTCACQCPTDIRCTGGQKLNLATCRCECDRNIECASRQTMNSATCTCACRTDIQCYGGKILNEDTCGCQCPQKSCPSGQSVNPITCNCECPWKSCPSGKSVNPSTCNCECSPKTCPNSKRLNPSTCNCECPWKSCPSGKSVNPNTCNCECTPKTCPNSKRLNPSTCTCECPWKSCPNGQSVNPSTCNCECPQKVCPYGQSVNSATCDCTCPWKSCPSGKTVNPTTCNCECPQKTCPGGQLVDPNTCNCGCLNTCPFGQDLDATTCVCSRRLCSKTCTSSQVQDPNTCACKCANDIVCPSSQTMNSISCTCACSPYIKCYGGKVLNETTCACQCPWKSCPSGQSVNPSTCNCECSPKTCPNSKRLNPSTCNCECPWKSCPNGQSVNPSTCNCECPQKVCPYGQSVNSATCDCSCPWKSCPSGKTVNPTTCNCECPQKTCPGGQLVDPSTCNCGCLNTCPLGQDLDATTCVCSRRLCSKTCTSSQVQDPNTCACKCANDIVCPSSQTMNSISCACECPWKSCPSGQSVNPRTCNCECTDNIRCSGTQQLNTDTCKCECPWKSCPSGQSVNPRTCNCECTDNVQCTGPQQLNTYTCKCECPWRSCPSGQSVNPSTCNCECPQKTCPGGQLVDPITCNCGCQKTCPAGQDLDATSCICSRRLCSDTCTSSQVQDPNTCACNCPQKYCSNGQVVNSNTCNCECPQKYCPSGQSVNPRTCNCEPTQVTQTCSAAESRCQNNQKAVRDCQGRCICHCDSNLYTGVHCEFPIKSDLCDNCTFINGRYIAPVKDRCDMFVVCQPLEGGQFLPRINFCGEGTILKNVGSQLLCASPSSTDVCPVDPCRQLPSGAKYGHSTLCGRYWQCQNGVTVSHGCCPQGQGFDTSLGRCAPDANCPNHCAKGFQSCSTDSRNLGQTSCPYIRGTGSEFHDRRAPKFTFHCVPNQSFNETTCRCMWNANGCKPYYDFDFDNGLEATAEKENVQVMSGVAGGTGKVGVFNDNSRIILRRFSASGFFLDYLQISLRLKLASQKYLQGGQRMAIVSNGDCGSEQTLGIIIDSNNVHFNITSYESKQNVVLSVPYNPNSAWLNIDFKFEREGKSNKYTMTANVDGQSKTQQSVGRIGTTVCSLQLGHGLGFNGLKGYVDDFKVMICKPSSSGLNNLSNRSGSSNTGGSNTQTAGSQTYGSGSITRTAGSQTYGSNTRAFGSNTYSGGSPYSTNNW